MANTKPLFLSIPFVHKVCPPNLSLWKSLNALEQGFFQNDKRTGEAMTNETTLFIHKVRPSSLSTQFVTLKESQRNWVEILSEWQTWVQKLVDNRFSVSFVTLKEFQRTRVGILSEWQTNWRSNDKRNHSLYPYSVSIQFVTLKESQRNMVEMLTAWQTGWISLLFYKKQAWI